jgi:hypothetical protein
MIGNARTGGPSHSRYRIYMNEEAGVWCEGVDARGHLSADCAQHVSDRRDTRLVCFKPKYLYA